MRDYLFEMLNALTSAYSRKDIDNRLRSAPVETNIGRLFALFAWGLNLVQEQAEKIKLWDNLENACGSVLDRYGANFGVKRLGADDMFYRLMIKVKMLSQISGGDTETVINAAAELLDVERSDILLEDVWPAKIALYVDFSLLDSDRIRMIEQIAYAIKRILAAGVGMRIYLRTYRVYRHALYISHGSMVRTEIRSEPVGIDRAHTVHILRRHAAFLQDESSAEPIGEDRAFSLPVPVTHGAFLPPAFDSMPPEPRKRFNKHQEIVGGAVYRTHIKPRRID